MTHELQPLAGAVMLPRHLIRPNPDQPREFFDADEMAGLRASIAEHGVRQPLTVRYEPSRYDGTPYVLLGGGRRFLASEDLVDELPAIIENVDAATARELALVDNLQRSPLLPLEEAKAVRDLMTRDGLTIDRVAARLGKSSGWVNNRLALLKAGKDVQEVAAQKPDAMSSLLLIESVKEPEARAQLLEDVQHDAPFKTIQTQVETYRVAQEHRERAAHHPMPDDETSERQGAYARGESAGMSRGKRVTGPKREEVRAEVQRALLALATWAPRLSREDYDDIVKPAARRLLQPGKAR